MEQEFVTSTEIGCKAKSKKDVHQLMVSQGRVYLPPLKETHHKFISQIVAGTKLVSRSFCNTLQHFKTDELRIIQVPFLKSLTIKKILDFAGDR